MAPHHHPAIEACARAAHEVNRAYCQALGDNSQVPWDEAPEWQRTSAINGARAVFANPNRQPGESHAGWMAEKEAAGWTWGKVKDPDAKEHPCMVPFEELPAEQQAKDHLFIATVRQVALALGIR
jgi:hypothetical protein